MFVANAAKHSKFYSHLSTNTLNTFTQIPSRRCWTLSYYFSFATSDYSCCYIMITNTPHFCLFRNFGIVCICAKKNSMLWRCINWVLVCVCVCSSSFFVRMRLMSTYRCRIVRILKNMKCTIFQMNNRCAYFKVQTLTTFYYKCFMIVSWRFIFGNFFLLFRYCLLLFIRSFKIRSLCLPSIGNSNIQMIIISNQATNIRFVSSGYCSIVPGSFVYFSQYCFHYLSLTISRNF